MVSLLLGSMAMLRICGSTVDTGYTTSGTPAVSRTLSIRSHDLPRLWLTNSSIGSPHAQSVFGSWGSKVSEVTLPGPGLPYDGLVHVRPQSWLSHTPSPRVPAATIFGAAGETATSLMANGPSACVPSIQPPADCCVNDTNPSAVPQYSIVVIP